MRRGKTRTLGRIDEMAPSADQWADPAAWERRKSAENCVICRAGKPNDVLVELDASWVTVGEDAPIRGYACLVFRRHAVELHELSEIEGQNFMRDIRRVSRAVQKVTAAVKLNYEVHGNSIPHLHMHFFPRYPGDPFGTGPINAKAVQRPIYAPGELKVLRSRLLEALNAA
jgi:diadenosine tetraphosphate (Ap4A) HIT family hydrolase